MHAPRFALSCLLVAALAGPALAQEPPPEVRLPLAQYEALMAGARDRGGPQPTWSTGTADVILPDQDGAFVSVEARGDFTIVGDGTAEVLLLPGQVVLAAVEIDGADGTLVQRGGAHVALVSGQSRHSVVLRYQVPRQPGADGSHLAVVPLPPFPGTRISVSGGQADQAIDVWPSGSVTSASPLVAQLPATPAAVLRWGSSGDLVRRVDYEITIDPGADGATIKARIEVDLDGPRGSVPLVPKTIALTEVSENGKPLPTRVVGDWHRATVVGAGRHVIVAELRAAIDRSEGQPQVTLPLPPAAPIVKIEAHVPGNRTVEFNPTVPVKTTVAGEGDAAITTAVGFLPPSDQVTVSWTEPRTAPEQVVSVNTETYQLVKIEEGVIRSKVEVRYEIIRGTLKELAIQLPDAAVLYKVTGEGIEDWRTFAAADGEPRQARVFLGSEREGTYKLELELEQVAPQTVGQPLDIPIVRPLGGAREMGVVALFDGDKVGFAEATPAGYVKSGEDALPIDVRQKLAGDIVSQAFKHIGQPGAVKSGVAAAKTRETRFDAHVESLYTFQQNALTVNNSVTIEVKSGRTDRIVLSLPANVKLGTDVSAPNLKKADWVEGGDEKAARRDYEILLTRALEGTIHIELSFEVILGSEVAKLALPDVRVQGADVKKGDLGITADPGIEVTQADLVGLRKLDIGELPNSIKLHSRREVQLGYSYSYVDEPWSLGLDVRRHRAVETLTAAIRQAWIETTVFEEGQVVTTALFRVQSEEQQHLRLKLPEGSKILGVTVAGERAEPIADETGALKIHLEKVGESLVEVIYMTKRDALGLLSSIDLEAPKPDVFVTDLQWLIRTPEKASIYGSSSELKELAPSRYRSPPSRPHVSGLGLSVSSNDPTTPRLYAIDVLDKSDAQKLTVSLSALSAPPALGVALLLVAAGLLVFGVWKRARREMSGGTWAMLIAGFVLLALRIVVFGVSGGEAILLALALAAVAVGTWLVRRRAAAAAAATTDAEDKA